MPDATTPTLKLLTTWDGYPRSKQTMGLQLNNDSKQTRGKGSGTMEGNTRISISFRKFNFNSSFK
jgi:hypothetical protein